MITNEPSDFPSILPEVLRPWMLHKGSLSQSFSIVAGEPMKILLKEEDFGTPLPEEIQSLKREIEKSGSFLKDNENFWIRRTFLGSSLRFFSYARVVVTPQAFNHYESRWRQLGNQLLGDGFLYTLKNLKRSEFTWHTISPTHPIYIEAQRGMDRSLVNDSLWARRSILMIPELILLTEVFLPPYLPYPCQEIS